MRIDLIRRTIDDINAATVGHPAGLACREVLVGVLDPAIVLVLEFVVFAVRIGIAALPEGLDELVALFIIRELHEGFALVVGNDPAHVFVQPLAVLSSQFALQRLGIFLLSLFVKRTFKRIGRIVVGLLGVLTILLGRLTIIRTRAGVSCRKRTDHK